MNYNKDLKYLNKKGINKKNFKNISWSTLYFFIHYTTNKM